MTVRSTSGTGGSAGATRPPGTRSRAGTFIWVLLLLLGAFFLFAVASDLAADARTGLPNDHAGTFTTLAGMSWETTKGSARGITRYVTLLEVAYAFHELVFALLYLVIVAIPFRQGMRRAWWACWAVEIANLAYLLTFGSHDAAILARALIAAIALPVLLLAAAPAFFRGAARRPVTSVS
jgi:hypothetical protein